VSSGRAEETDERPLHELFRPTPFLRSKKVKFKLLWRRQGGRFLWARL